METQINIDDSKPVKLSDTEQEELKQHILEIWDKGKKARAPYETQWEIDRKSYRCEIDKIKDPTLEWRTELYLPWAFDALESWYAYMHSMLLPKDEDIFSITGRTTDDDAACDVMTQYLQYVFNRNGLSERFGEALKQYGMIGPTVLKVYWREDKRSYFEYELQPVMGVAQDPETGNPIYDEVGSQVSIQTGVKRVKVPKETTIYNNVWFDVVDIDNFVFYPTSGDINKTTRIHQTYRFLEDLQADAESGLTPYFNIDKLKDEDNDHEDNVAIHAPMDFQSGTAENQRKKHQGINIKEAWIHRVKIGDKVYKNYIATIANDKTLIRFMPNPMEMGESPFIYSCRIPDRMSLLGNGLLTKGQQLLRYANFLASSKADILKVDMYPGHKYVDDGVFNPYGFIARPGFLVKVGDINNIQPLQTDLSKLNITFEEIQYLKEEYDEVTVPRIVRGQEEAGQTTATATNITQNNASGKMHVDGQHINESLLKPFFEKSYLLVRQRAQEDPRVLLDIARVTQPSTQPMVDPQTGQPIPGMMAQKTPEELMQSLPEFLPLPEVDINIVGYQNSIRKQQALQAGLQLVPQIAQSPAAKYLQWYELSENALKLADLDPNIYMVDKSQKEALDQQEAQAQQQQQQMMQAEMQMKQQAAEAQMAGHQVHAQQVQVDAQKNTLDVQQRQAEVDAKTQIELAKIQSQNQIQMMQLQLEQQRLQLEASKVAISAAALDNQEPTTDAKQK